MRRKQHFSKLKTGSFTPEVPQLVGTDGGLGQRAGTRQSLKSSDRRKKWTDPAPEPRGRERNRRKSGGKKKVEDFSVT
ncbi:unnamed protein product [Pleuronectes platessa]|uniref:Uncharacterized protein n=1 Tax=Pleuronectes platessa TaxID=8262 RepID=A0A9N7YPM6_PLEPL|nr:unnamed protein product [Pleuronectes platessa]